MTTTVERPDQGVRERTLVTLNTRGHKLALYGFMFIVIAHWAEHIIQVVQIYLLDWPRPESRGLIGHYVPWLNSSEWLHYGYAVVMLIGLVALRSGFTGRSRTWWNVAMWIQVWHHFEHLILLAQAVTGSYLFGWTQPVSILQLVILRPELHLIYNAAVTVPMVVAMIYHMRPSTEERAQMRCSCAVTGKSS